MVTSKTFRRSIIAVLVSAVFGCVGAVGFEVLLELSRWEFVSRDYKAGLWVSDLALVLGLLLAIFGGCWGWKDAGVFRDLILVDFVDWIRSLWKSP
ncbi:hypothetical protein GCM10011309_12370 [Litorimonas cladophorae]|uniref:Uncharacterized protein n=1 Tax=Litorimonas cladophorae TaxID=1220491 RepID=A0A918NFL3_9PROT|nr:hypothetical protein [Litorimonas cladophorae]GGX63863.1 hypothetical protein GCM10011309_12370 [Litorimonas cladophorae]